MPQPRLPFALTLSYKEARRLEKALLLSGVEQERFLRSCVLTGIKETELRHNQMTAHEAEIVRHPEESAGLENRQPPHAENEDVKFLERLYKLKDSRADNRRTR